MRLDTTSIMFNMNLEKDGGNPSWGTALGQSGGHRFTQEGCEEIIVGMLYSKIDEKKVKCPLGKGGNKQDDYEYVLASKFDKVYVNDVLIPDSSFILLIVKQLVASDSAQQHIGRRTLKYSLKIQYENQKVNNDCYNKILKTLDLSSKAAWFISDIHIVNQDELHFEAKIVDKYEPKFFFDSKERKAFCDERADIIDVDDIFVEVPITHKEIPAFSFDETLVLGKKKKTINIK